MRCTKTLDTMKCVEKTREIGTTMSLLFDNLSMFSLICHNRITCICILNKHNSFQYTMFNSIINVLHTKKTQYLCSQREERNKITRNGSNKKKEKRS